ncbi:MAG: hypothetical protein GY786_12325, partial [Proteobacteria bacterium]|nr:hypothetical protein [Pseudomonadota bacterium]
MFIMEDGLNPKEDKISFSVPIRELMGIDKVTMRFSTSENPENDRNFVFFTLPELSSSDITVKSEGKDPKQKTVVKIAIGDDFRFKTIIGSEEGISYDLIESLWFNSDSNFGSSDSLAAEVLEKGKNPGLGVRTLHSRGITGRGINVGIIDQNIAGSHPEYIGRIKAYMDVGCNQSSDSGSMHGPAVLSLLAGKEIGTAPEANVYFAAAPSWTGDSKFQSQALEWIIEENRKLADDEKIRVVSVSAAPSGEGAPFTKNHDDWDNSVKKAEAEGILVLDCTTDHGFIGGGYYNPEKP